MKSIASAENQIRTTEEFLETDNEEKKKEKRKRKRGLNHRKKTVPYNDKHIIEKTGLSLKTALETYIGDPSEYYKTKCEIIKSCGHEPFTIKFSSSGENFESICDQLLGRSCEEIEISSFEHTEFRFGIPTLITYEDESTPRLHSTVKLIPEPTLLTLTLRETTTSPIFSYPVELFVLPKVLKTRKGRIAGEFFEITFDFVERVKHEAKLDFENYKAPVAKFIKAVKFALLLANANSELQLVLSNESNEKTAMLPFYSGEDGRFEGLLHVLKVAEDLLRRFDYPKTEISGQNIIDNRHSILDLSDSLIRLEGISDSTVKQCAIAISQIGAWIGEVLVGYVFFYVGESKDIEFKVAKVHLYKPFVFYKEDDHAQQILQIMAKIEEEYQSSHLVIR